MTTERPLRDTLRQMLALLEDERQALAGLDLDAIMQSSDGKLELCEAIERQADGPLDEECRGLLDAVARLNAVNRKIRNLIAANVEARLGTLAGRISLYGSGRPAVSREVPYSA
ncbi:flagellar protein FlgN [Pelagerythrobacter marensis]|uniref:Flagellar protein FlgN n=1 Tax=Pelagerythrobacter marensis TaxID=543877 RepID=A0ABZ2D9H6_9SPHN